MLAVNCCFAEAMIVAEAGETEIVVTTMDALAVTDASALLVAVMVWVPIAAGAVYAPPVVIVPTVAFPPLTPSTDHVTAVFEKPCTVALNCSVPDGITNAEVGLTAVIPTATVAFALIDGTETIAALTVCDPAVAGAVYIPDALIVPTVAFPPATPSTYQVTALLPAPCTVAVNCVLPLTGRLTDDWFSAMVGVVVPALVAELFTP
jgi:hypothetical protein